MFYRTVLSLILFVLFINDFSKTNYAIYVEKFSIAQHLPRKDFRGRNYTTQATEHLTSDLPIIYEIGTGNSSVLQCLKFQFSDNSIHPSRHPFSILWIYTAQLLPSPTSYITNSKSQPENLLSHFLQNQFPQAWIFHITSISFPTPRGSIQDSLSACLRWCARLCSSSILCCLSYQCKS